MRNRIYYSKEAEQRARVERFLLVIIGIVGGLSLGAILVALFSPDAVRRIRQQLAADAETALHEGQAASEKVVENVREKLEALRETAAETAERIR